MAFVSFTGNEDIAGGTSLDFLLGLNQEGGLGNNDNDRVLEFSVTNGAFGATGRYGWIYLTELTPSSGIVTSFTGSGNSGGVEARVIRVAGLQEAVQLDPDISAASQRSVVLAQLPTIFTNFLRGDDTIELTGEVARFWGDYRTVTPAASATMGDDFFSLDGVVVPSGSTSVILFGDAQSVASGATAHGGDDIIDSTHAGAALTVFGDFQFIEGTATFGNDTIYGSGLSYTLYGDSQTPGATGGNDFIAAGNGSDQLFGGGGNDILAGEAGDDALDGGAGTDLASYETARDPVVADLLSPTGNTNDAAGDAYFGIEGLVGSRHADTLRGNDAANRLLGGAGADSLLGRGGNDILNGELGADSMTGGIGNDFYYVDNSMDVTIEAASQGSDIVYASVSYTLGASQEIETFATANQAGTAAINLTGNNLAQRINGNNGNNVLYGGAGNDLLVGYGGNDNIEGQAGADTLKGVSGIDRFVFRQSTVATAGADHISDFGADDFIYFDHPSVTGALSPLAFVAGANALDANDRFIYYAPHKSLYFDPDGNGAAAKVLFAVFDNGYTPTAADIILF